MLEPLNTNDNPGYCLAGSAQAHRIIELVGSERLAIQLDPYHTQLMEGSLSDTVRSHIDVIGHVQAAGVPGRHEPDEQQEVNCRYLFVVIDSLGFEGWVGCEYVPRAGTVSGLSWAQRYGPGTAPAAGGRTEQ